MPKTHKFTINILFRINIWFSSLISLFQILVRSIAVADIGYTVVVIFPTVISTISNAWVLGDIVCKASVFLQFLFGEVNLFCICALSVSKLTCLLHPLRARNRTVKTGYIIIAVIWAISFIHPISLTRYLMVYVPPIYRCVVINTEQNKQKKLVEVLSKNVVFLFLPMLVTVVSTLWLLVYVRRKTSLRLQGVAVVVMVSVAFLASWCPFMMYTTAKNFVSTVPIVYMKLGIFCIYINSACNPYLYFLSSNSFKEFVRGKLWERSMRPTISYLNNSSRDKEKDIIIISSAERFRNLDET